MRLVVNHSTQAIMDSTRLQHQVESALSPASFNKLLRAVCDAVSDAVTAWHWRLRPASDGDLVPNTGQPVEAHAMHNAPADAGTQAQLLHTDWGRGQWRACLSCTPFGVLLALQPCRLDVCRGCLLHKRGPHNRGPLIRETIALRAGGILIFRGDLVHGGSAYVGSSGQESHWRIHYGFHRPATACPACGGKDGTTKHSLEREFTPVSADDIRAAGFVRTWRVLARAGMPHHAFASTCAA